MAYSAQFYQKFVAFLIIILSTIAAGLSFFIPVAPTVQSPTQAHWRTAVAVLVASLFCGSAIWFLTGLARFKTALRIAYTLLGLGLITFGLATLQLPVIGLFDLWKSVWILSGGVLLPFILGSILTYWAMRQFARTLGLRNRTMSFLLVSATAIGFAVLMFIAAYYFSWYKEEGLEIYIATIAWAVIYVFFATLLANTIARAIGPSYQRAMKWQTIAFFVLILASLHEMLGSMISPSSGTLYQDYGLYLWPFAVTGLLFLRATYEFRLLTARTITTEQDRQINRVEDSDYTDSIIAVAGLASRPQEIDPILDEMRAITSRLPANAKLSNNDKGALLQVYARLEAYMIENESLRHFTQEEIRGRVSPGFNATLVIAAKTRDIGSQP